MMDTSAPLFTTSLALLLFEIDLVPCVPSCAIVQCSFVCDQNFQKKAPLETPPL
jgi:hypothetical protein